MRGVLCSESGQGVQRKLRQGYMFRLLRLFILTKNVDHAENQIVSASRTLSY